MTFTRQKITTGNIKLTDLVIPAHQQAVFDQYQQIIEQANANAQAITERAHQAISQAQAAALKKANKTQQRLADNMQNMLNQAKAQVASIQEAATAEAQQAVFSQAMALLSELNDEKQAFYQASMPLIKNMLHAIVDKFTQSISIKDRLEILAEQVLQKAATLEQGAIYMHPEAINQLPELHLPLNWKIISDVKMTLDACKVQAGGSEWRIHFEDMRTVLLAPFIVEDADVEGVQGLNAHKDEAQDEYQDEDED